MAVTVTSPIEYHAYWEAEGVSYGGLDGYWSVQATINDAMTEMTLVVTCKSFSTFDSQGSGSSFNTVALTGLLNPRADPDFLDRRGSGYGDESASGIKEEVSQSSYGTNYDSIASHYLFIAGISESAGSNWYEGIVNPGDSRTLTRALSDADFDADGNWIAKPLFNVSNRFWNNNGDQTGQVDVDGETIALGDRLISTEEFSVNFNSFNYFPGMIKKPAEWKSCNRWYDDATQGHVTIRKDGGTWRDVTNTLNPRATNVNKGIYRTGSWQSQQLIGADKDTRYNK